MRIFFILLMALSLYAGNFVTKITDVSGNVIQMEASVKKGTSGIVLCPYEKEKIICARCVGIGGNKALLYTYSDLKNEAFALPLVLPKIGDDVIFGKNYDRIMIIAPNLDTYLKLKNRFSKFTIIPVDVFGAFLEDLPTKADFINFAKKMDIGLYIFALDKLYFVDALSFYAISEEDFSFNGKFKLPFYTSYPFDFKLNNPISYYKSMIKE